MNGRVGELYLYKGRTVCVVLDHGKTLYVVDEHGGPLVLVYPCEMEAVAAADQLGMFDPEAQ